MMAYHLLPMVAWQASASCVLVLVYIPQPRHIILLVGFCCLCLSVASKAVHWSISILFNRSDTAGFGGKSDFLRFSLFCLPFRRFWELYQSENSTGIYTFSAFRTRRDCKYGMAGVWSLANFFFQIGLRPPKSWKIVLASFESGYSCNLPAKRCRHRWSAATKYFSGFKRAIFVKMPLLEDKYLPKPATYIYIWPTTLLILISNLKLPGFGKLRLSNFHSFYPFA